MALQKTITLDNGLTVENAYIKVCGISGDKSCITFNLGAFIDKEHSSEQPLKYFYNSFTPNLNESNFIAQTYDFAKSLDEFNGAIDC